MQIMKKECPPEYEQFIECLNKNPDNTDKCLDLRQKLFDCGKPGIRKANADPNYTY